MGFDDTVRGVRLAALAVLLSSPASVVPDEVAAQETELAARVWLDRGEEPLLQPGDAVRLYYNASHDAFVAIFQIDTNGGVRLVFPRSPDENHFVRGGRDYRLLFPRSPYWRVDDDPGVGYFFVVASPEPFDFSSLPYSHYGRGWDLSRVGRPLYQDPYVAMDDWVATLIPDWEVVPYALDFATYHVGDRYDYPRFLCYDCHGFRPFYAWNPYHYSCTEFRVVIVNDPYYYPVTRYRGSRVVYVRPPEPFQPRFAFKERAAGEPATPLVMPREAVPRRSTADQAIRRPGAVEGFPGRDPRVPVGEGGVVWPGGATPGRLTPPSGEPRRPSTIIRYPRSGEPTGIQAPARGGDGVRSPAADARGDDPGRPVLERRPQVPTGEGGVRPGGGPVVRPTDPGSRGPDLRPSRDAGSSGGARPSTPPRRPSAAVPRGGDPPSSGSSGVRPPSSGSSTGRPGAVRRPPPPTRPPGEGTDAAAAERDRDREASAPLGGGIPVGDLGGPPPRGVPVGELGRSSSGGSPAPTRVFDRRGEPRGADLPEARERERAAEPAPVRSSPPAEGARERRPVRSMIGGVLDRVRGSNARSEASERPAGDRDRERGVATSAPSSRPSVGAGMRRAPSNAPQTGSRPSRERAAPRGGSGDEAGSRAGDPAARSPQRSSSPPRSDPPPVRRPATGPRRPPPPSGR